jgi:NHL repeat-containing protein
MLGNPTRTIHPKKSRGADGPGRAPTTWLRHGPAHAASLRLLAAAAVSAGALVASIAAGASAPAGAAPTPFLSHFNNVNVVASTVPNNGDVNPYGVANVPFSIGTLVRGDTLVSNFNSINNLQGTGTTIVQVGPNHQVGLFAQINPYLPGCPGGVGLTTALSVLNDGYVVVGSLPVTKDGSGTPEAGCLIVLNPNGVPVETWAGNGINGPWDMTSTQIFGPVAELFVTNVLNGTVARGGSEVDQGTVLRLGVFDPPGRPPVLFSTTTIATGLAEELNSNALVLGPTGVALGAGGTLYVADTVHSRIAVVPFATSRFSPVSGNQFTLSAGGSLNSPLGLVSAPNGDLIAVNGNDGNAVEVSRFGAQVDTKTIDPFNSGGDLFGLAIAPAGNGVLFVDDNSAANTLDVLH